MAFTQYIQDTELQERNSRPYLHESGKTAFRGLNSARAHLNQILTSEDPPVRGRLDHLMFNVPLLWAYHGEGEGAGNTGEHLMVDLIGYFGMEEDWGTNGDMRVMVFKNGVWQPDYEDVTCEDGRNLLTLEGLRRDMCSCLDEYMTAAPIPLPFERPKSVEALIASLYSM
jgi:hypothetical protein